MCPVCRKPQLLDPSNYQIDDVLLRFLRKHFPTTVRCINHSVAPPELRSVCPQVSQVDDTPQTRVLKVPDASASLTGGFEQHLSPLFDFASPEDLQFMTGSDPVPFSLDFGAIAELGQLR